MTTLITYNTKGIDIRLIEGGTNVYFILFTLPDETNEQRLTIISNRKREFLIKKGFNPLIEIGFDVHVLTQRQAYLRFFKLCKQAQLKQITFEDYEQV